MKTNFRLTISIILLIMVMCVSLTNTTSVFADEGTPTAPPVPTDTPTEPPVLPTDLPLEATEAPATEEAIATEIPVEATSLPEEVVDVPEIDDLLTEVPENTDVVILDENGNPVTLASQEAVDIILEADPMWCPVNAGVPVLPNGSGCTGNMTVSQLLDSMELNTAGFYSRPGIIYFERSGLTTYTSFILNNSTASLGASYDTLKNFNLTLRGGWNGGGNNTFHASESSVFDNNNNAVFSIGYSTNPWVGNITIQDILIQDNDSGTVPSLSVFTTSGAIALNDVDVDDQEDGQYTAYLDSASGNISVTNGSSFDGAGDNQGFYAQTDTGSITITGTSSNRITFTDADGGGNNYNGATLSAPTVSLTYVTSDGNDLNGIAISNANSITLNNVIATNNGTSVSGPDLGSGVRIFGTGTTIVNVTQGTFSNNERYGIEMSNVASITTSGVSMSGNGEGNIVNDSTPPTINPSVTCTQPGNAGWCRGTININWNVSDAQSAVNTSGCQTTYNTNTSPAGTVLSCSATSTGGTTSASVTVFRDGTGPNTTATKSPGANGQGWNNTDVTVTFTGSDSNSGLASCTGAITVTTEGSNQPVSGSCTDVAGNVDNETTNVSIDKTPPTVTATRTAPNSNGWNTGSVTVAYNPSDNLSGIPLLGCNPLLRFHLVTSEGANQSRTGTCTDRAGNVGSVTVSNINIDLTNPVATATKSPLPNSNGWNNTDVVVTFSGSDNPSGIASCTSPATVSTEGTNQSRSGNCTDLSGRVSSTVTANNINIDKTPPTITLVSRTPANANGWNNTDVVVTWSCSDSRSGVVSASVSQTVSSQGANQSATGTCTDRAGNTASNTQTGINIDKTAPNLTLPANFSVEATSASGAPVTFSTGVTDNLDGSVTVSCSPVSGSTFPIATTTVACSSTDHANNTANGSFNVTVQDTTPPTLSLPSDITEEAVGSSGNIISFTASASDIVDGTLPVTCIPASGSTFPIGTTNVSCSATDSKSNTSTGSFNVIVRDTTPPVIASHADETAEATSALGAIVTYTSPSTSDVVDGAGTATCLPASGSQFALGNTTVTCNATDAHANAAVPTTFVVHVVDTTPPVIASHGDIFTKTSKKGGAVINYIPPSTTDIVDGTGTATCTPAPGSTFPVGFTIVICTAVDAHGNTAIPVTFAIDLEFQEASTGSVTPDLFIPVTGGGSIDLTCISPSSFRIQTEGARFIFNNLCGYQAFVEGVEKDSLPGKSPNNATFEGSFTVNILKDGKVVKPLPADSNVNIQFEIPANQQNKNFAVYEWNGKEWIEVAGQKTADGFFNVTVTEGGTFMFVAKQ